MAGPREGGRLWDPECAMQRELREYEEEGRAREIETETEGEEEGEGQRERRGEKREKRRGEGEAESCLFRTIAGKREPRPAWLCRREKLEVGGACLLKGQCTDWESQHNHNMDLGDGSVG